MQPNDLALALSHLLSQTVLTLGGRAISAGEILAAFGAFIVAVLVLWLFLSWRAGQRRAAEAAVAAERAHEAETRMAELIATQNALAGDRKSVV